jgi:2-dehydro-3-deoxyphosphogluconate aldolase/(4S)-4-hydroxy-2-oxoglutarate aldolase
MSKSISASVSSKRIQEICCLTKVIPVLSVDRIEDSIPLGQALVDGGLKVLEVTLRTKNALSVINEMSKIDGAFVGVGTLLSEKDVQDAVESGAQFGVSPGITSSIINACEKEGLPLLAGVSTVSEAMQMLERGYETLKFFPAEVSGGVNALKAIAGPLPEVKFCPTGGVNHNNAENYLLQKNVVCVGGSWMAPQDMIEKKEWSTIRSMAETASKIGSK